MNDKDKFLTVIKLLGIVVLLLFSADYQITYRLNQLLSFHGYIHVMIFILIWVSCFISILLASFSPQFLLRFIFSLLFFTTTLLSVAYSSLSGEPIQYDNLYVLLENMSFASGAIQHYLPEILSALFIAGFSLIIILPVPGYFSHYYKGSFKKFGIYSILFLPFILLSLITWPRGGYGLAEIPVQFKIPTLISLITFESIVSGEIKRQGVDEYHVFDKKNKQNIVLIVDESVRGDYIDINNNQNITPYLLSQKDRIVNFGYASSGANCSAASNQILRFGPNIDDFSKTFVTNPYIWQYAKKAGYTTIMIEGQKHEGQLNNRIKKKEISYIDKIIYAKGETVYERDKYIATLIKKYTGGDKKTNNSKPFFIYAVKAGVHFSYEPLTPNDKKLFNTKGVANEKEKLINSYKNAINYVIDSFFYFLLHDVEYKNTIIFYTSDHGQNLLDNGFTISHCSIRNVSLYEGLVPLFIISDNEISRKPFLMASKFNQDKLSHFNIFPTLLNIFGFDEKETMTYHGSTMFNPDTSPRKFVSGRIAANRLLKDNKDNFNRRNNWNELPESFIKPSSNITAAPLTRHSGEGQNPFASK